MLPYLSALHTGANAGWMDARVRVQRRQLDGSWQTIRENVPCAVQLPLSDYSSQDRDRAKTEEISRLSAYFLPGTDIDVGDRVWWKGAYWHVHADAEGRSTTHAFRVGLSLEQSGVAPELIRFRRRLPDRTWHEVGEFPVRVTLGLRYNYPDTVMEDSADAAERAGIMIGGPESVAVQPGDVFGRDGLPGVIVSVDRDDPEWVEIGFILEVEAI